MKNLKKLGTVLNKTEQKEVNGGRLKPFLCGPLPNTIICYFPSVCTQGPNGYYCA